LELVESAELRQALTERLHALRETSPSRHELIGRALALLN